MQTPRPPTRRNGAGAHDRDRLAKTQRGAFFTGLRKKGHTLLREERTSGELAYRLVQDTQADEAAA